MAKRLLSLKEMREKAGLTQRDVTDKLGFSSPQFLSNCERGICLLPYEHYKPVAKLYGVSIDNLIDLKIANTRKKLMRAFSK